ncbi:MAG: sulfatase-like hydrolase/transferase [Victivallaceae bacterium]|nr:sulfatase-like hydrolase/transferase [Victivallaceae bacterium]
MFHSFLCFLHRRSDILLAAPVFGMLNFCVFALIGALNWRMTPLSVSTLTGNLYSVILFFGHLGLFAVALAAVVAMFGLIGKKTALVGGCVLGTAVCFLFFSDWIVFSQYKFHISLAMIGLFASPAGSELVSFPPGMIAAIAGIIVLFAGVEFGFAMLARWKKLRIAGAFFFLLVLVCAPAYHIWNSVATFRSSAEYLERNAVLPFSFGMTCNDLLERMGFSRPDSRMLAPLPRGGNFRYPAKPLVFRSDAPRRNVLFVLVDSLRADLMNPEVTPFLSQMSKEGAYFTNHVSSGNCTRSGLFGLFNAIPSTYWDNAARSLHGSALVESLVDRGYQAQVFSSSTMLAPEFDRTVFHKIPGLRVKSTGKTKIERDNDSIAAFSDFLKKRDREKPYFAMLMVDSLHGCEIPKDFPRKFQTDLTGINYLAINGADEKMRREMFNLTRNATAYIDHVMEKVFALVRAHGDWENTLLVFSSDHGNECNETGTNSWGHNSNFTRYQIHVPLVLLGKGVVPGVYAYRTSHLDVAPTLLRLLGCENAPADFSTGRDLFNPASRDPIALASYASRAMLWENHIFEISGPGIVRQYDFDGHRETQGPDKELLQRFFKDISRFLH